jgi:hypothetical protein
MGKKAKVTLLVLVAVFVIMQLFRSEQTNPPTDPAASFEATAKPSPQVKAVVERACQDCHSNRTVWPWYSRVAPASWLVTSDVSEARQNINFSEWGLLSPEKRLEALGDICREVTAGDMPLWQYKILHPAARLGAGDADALCLLSVPARQPAEGALP